MHLLTTLRCLKELLSTAMTQYDFTILDISQQEELMQRFGKFIQTQLIGHHLCDIYSYNDYFVVFYYLSHADSTIRCKCFPDLTGMELFILALYSTQS
jgi:hypothetical protein